MYHVCTPLEDKWVKNKATATKLFNKLKKEGNSVKMYEEVRGKNDELISEKRIKSFEEK